MLVPSKVNVAGPAMEIGVPTMVLVVGLILEMVLEPVLATQM